LVIIETGHIDAHDWLLLRLVISMHGLNMKFDSILQFFRASHSGLEQGNVSLCHIHSFGMYHDITPHLTVCILQTSNRQADYARLVCALVCHVQCGAE